MRRRVLTILRVGLAVALLSYIVRSDMIDWAAFAGIARAWPAALAGFILILACMTATAARLCVLMAPHGLKLSLANSFRLTLIGMFFNTWLLGATGGDAVKIYYAMGGQSGRRTEIATVILFDRVMGMIGLLLWPLLFAPFAAQLLRSSPILSGLLYTAAAVLLAVILVMIAFSSPAITDRLLETRLLRRFAAAGYAARIAATVRSYRSAPGALATSIGLSLLAHTLAVATVLVVGRTMNPAAFSWAAAVLVPMGFVANAVPITPGGLGVGEAAFEQLFALAGLDGGAEFMLGWRVQLLAISLIGLLFYLQGRRQLIQPHATVQTDPPVVRTEPSPARALLAAAGFDGASRSHAP